LFQRVKALMITVLALAVLALSVTFYRSCGARSVLDVDPHARKEIEKARQR
jgi:hypothetical protein